MRRLVLAGLLATAVGCGGEKKPGPVEPVAGDLTVAYTGPSQTDGAMLVIVTGAITAVKPANGYTVASASLGPTSTRVVVTGDLAVGDLFKVSVADVGRVSSYSVQVEAAADRNTFALGNPGAYSATVRR
ncbi:MAG: hypothetical protein JNJ80_03435 [Gemmatimonadetes bacterium]|nr:hypothetical protein [Gemmatimonadota bacterium]MCC7134563.1 hypothetical protein [Gemmatimonadales bacterium]